MTTTARRRDCHLTCRHPSGRERAKRPAGRIPPAPPAVVKRPRKTPRPLAKRSPRELSELAAAGPPPSPVLHRTTYLGCHLHVFAEGSRARQVAADRQGAGGAARARNGPHQHWALHQTPFQPAARGDWRVQDHDAGAVPQRKGKDQGVDLARQAHSQFHIKRAPF